MYNNWSNKEWDEPNNIGGYQNCVYMQWPDKMWLDGNCDTMRNVICEMIGIAPVVLPAPPVVVPPVVVPPVVTPPTVVIPPTYVPPPNRVPPPKAMAPPPVVVEPVAPPRNVVIKPKVIKKKLPDVKPPVPSVAAKKPTNWWKQ